MCKGSIPFIWFDFIRSRVLRQYSKHKKKQKRGEKSKMSRARKVTRTISSTKVIIMCVDTETAKVDNYEVTIAGTYTDEKKLMKAVTKVVETETLKPVSIVSTEVIETLYGMDEQKFIEMAEVLPPRGKKEDTDEVEE